MKYMKKIFFPVIASLFIFTACEKKASPVDTNNAKISLNDGGPKFVTGDITVNPNDSIFFSYSVSAEKDMKFVGIQKNPVNQTAFVVRDTLSAANKNTYSAVKRLKADSINGTYIYRVAAHDAAGNYIGAKDVIVTVKADYNYFSYRFLRVPDTTAKTNTCYLSATTGTVYSYTTGAAASSTIDMGFYYDTATANKFSVYDLNAVQPQLSFYDISTWTKNVTIMKKATTPAFNTLTSGGSLRSAGIANLASGTTNKVTALAAGNLVYFKTSTGKVGCMNVNYINGSNGAKDSYINVDVKIEK
jgi:hypothetical protein